MSGHEPMSRERILMQAKETAKKMADRLEEAYTKSVERNIETYDDVCFPDDEDFFSWVEGYGWEEVEINVPPEDQAAWYEQKHRDRQSID